MLNIKKDNKCLRIKVDVWARLTLLKMYNYLIVLKQKV